MKVKWMKWMAACLLLGGAMFAGGSPAWAQSKKMADKKAHPAKEMMAIWNDIGNRLVEMAQDWPEDKLDFRPSPEQRTFAQQLLHAAGTNNIFTAAVQGKEPDMKWENPSRDTYKTKAQIVEFVKKSVADGAAAIQAAGDGGMMDVVKYPYSEHGEMFSRYFCMAGAAEHMGEHYGQLVVYYRVNNMVPPSSRPKK
jgi:hypothetical protein